MERYQIQEDNALYYLTFSVVHWLPVFVSEAPCQIICESLNFCHKSKGLEINAFVIMPTHIHLIVFDHDFNVDNLRAALIAMRKFTGRRLADYCNKSMPGIFGQVLAAGPRTDRKRQFWQQSRHPEAIFSEPFWRTKFNYVHDNPCRKGLVTDPTYWRFSSASYWYSDPPGPSDVMLTAVRW